MFTAITLQYLGAGQLEGGRRPVDSEVSINVVWSPVNKMEIPQRYQDLGVEIEATVLLEDQTKVLDIIPEETQVDKNGVTYEIIEAEQPPLDLGLEQTYFLFLKKMKEKT